MCSFFCFSPTDKAEYCCAKFGEQTSSKAAVLGIYRWTRKRFRGLLWSQWPLTTAGQQVSPASDASQSVAILIEQAWIVTKLYRRIFLTNEEHYRRIVSNSPLLDSIQTSHVFSRKTRVQKGCFSKHAVRWLFAFSAKPNHRLSAGMALCLTNDLPKALEVNVLDQVRATLECAGVRLLSLLAAMAASKKGNHFFSWNGCDKLTFLLSDLSFLVMDVCASLTAPSLRKGFFGSPLSTQAC